MGSKAEEVKLPVMSCVSTWQYLSATALPEALQ